MILKFKEEAQEFFDINDRNLDSFNLGNRLTLFTGINNSGKSRLLRRLFIETINNKDELGIDDAFYIPVARSMRPLSKNNYDLYAERIIRDYFTSVEARNVITGQSFYSIIKDMYFGSEDDRLLLTQIEKYIGDNFFDSTIKILPLQSSDTLSIKIGAEEERPIYDLGDGVQQMLIITLTALLNKNKNTIIFIEEPETYLHPLFVNKLKDVMLEELLSKCKFVFSSHSAEFIMSAEGSEMAVYKLEDISIIDETKLTNTNRFRVTLSLNPSKDYKLLNSLGIRSSAYLKVPCVIWVENLLDISYIRALLSGTQYKETLEYGIYCYQFEDLKVWAAHEQSSLDLEVFSQNNLFLINENNNIKDNDSIIDALKDKYEVFIINVNQMEDLINYSDFKNFLEVYSKKNNIKLRLKSENALDLEDEFKAGIVNYLEKSYQPGSLLGILTVDSESNNQLNENFKKELSTYFYENYKENSGKLNKHINSLKKMLIEFIATNQ